MLKIDSEVIASWLASFEGEVEPPAEVIDVLEELAFAHANPEADWASFAAACGLGIAIAAAKDDVTSILHHIGWIASFLCGLAEAPEHYRALSGIHDLASPWMDCLPAAGELEQAVAEAATSTHH